MAFVTKNSLILFSSIALLMMSQNVQADTCTKPKVKGYEYVGCLHDGLAGVVTKDNKVGFVNQSGKLVIPSIYDAESMGEGGEVSGTHDFSEGLVSVRKSITGSDAAMQGSYGYIDTTGKVVIPFTLGYTAKFSNGLAIVQNENGIGAIDKFEEDGSINDEYRIDYFKIIVKNLKILFILLRPALNAASIIELIRSSW